MNNLKRVAVTGATGYVGRFVVAELQRHQVAVRALARPSSQRDGFATPFEWIIGDLNTEAALNQLVQDVDAVIHLAYEHVPGRYRGGEGDDLPAWLEANLNGSLRLLLAARAARVPRFIFLSSRAVFSATQPGRVLDESHPTNPDTHYGAYKAAVESFLQSFSHAEGMQTSAIRATGVYGLTWPVERSKWWNLIQAVLHDEPITSSGGGTEVHGADVAGVIWHLLNLPGSLPPVIHLSDLYVTHQEVVRLARTFANRPGPLPPLPAQAPSNRLVSYQLPALGLQLGGTERLSATVNDIVQTAELFNMRKKLNS